MSDTTLQIKWALLRKQKSTLMRVMNNKKLCGDADTMRTLGGLVAFLDHIQDVAVSTNTATVEEVFGESL